MTNIEDYHLFYSRSFHPVACIDREVYCFQREAIQFLASKMVQGRFVENKKDFSTTMTVDLYVFSPDNFWRIVQEEAMKLNSYHNFTKM